MKRYPLFFFRQEYSKQCHGKNRKTSLCKIVRSCGKKRESYNKLKAVSDRINVFDVEMPAEIHVIHVPECKLASITTVERTFFPTRWIFLRRDINLKYKICSWLCSYYIRQIMPMMKRVKDRR